MALLLVVLSLFVINRLLRMLPSSGRAWEALREDENGLPFAGLKPASYQADCLYHQCRVCRFCRNAVCCAPGLCQPGSFTFAESAFVLAIVVLGGMGSQFAVILAADLTSVVSRELMRDFNEYGVCLMSRWFDGADDDRIRRACCP